jgi:3-deoxy-D-manno-octulosonic acid kinase
MLLKSGYKEILLSQGIENFEDFLRRYGRPSPHLEGRVRHLSVSLGKGEKMVVRQYSHGGLFQVFTRDLYLSGPRPFRELFLTEEIRSAGISTIEPIGVILRPAFHLFYKAYFLSLEIPDARDLTHYLLKKGTLSSPENLVEKRGVIRSVGDLLQQFHERGFFHGDLQLKNILIAGTRPLLIDFDRSYRKTVLSLKERLDNLLRLNRSVEKWRRMGLPITRTDRWRFFSAYSGGDQLLQESLEKALRTYGLRLLPHRGLWRLGEMIKGSRGQVRKMKP